MMVYYFLKIACSFQVMKALSEILLDEFVFPKSQPEGEHLELWSIDKPKDLSYFLIDFYQKNFSKNMKSFYTLYDENSKIEYNEKTIKGLDEIQEVIFLFYYLVLDK
jgi:hypothetical protein